MDKIHGRRGPQSHQRAIPAAALNSRHARLAAVLIPHAHSPIVALIPALLSPQLQLNRPADLIRPVQSMEKEATFFGNAMDVHPRSWH